MESEATSGGWNVGDPVTEVGTHSARFQPRVGHRNRDLSRARGRRGSMAESEFIVGLLAWDVRPSARTQADFVALDLINVRDIFTSRHV